MGELRSSGTGMKSARRYGIAIAAVAAAWAARTGLDPYYGNHMPYVTFFVAVTVSAWVGGLGPALLSTGLGFFIAEWFFIAPRHMFATSAMGGWAAVGSYFMVTLMIALFGHVMHRARDEALARQRELEEGIAERERVERALETARREAVSEKKRLEAVMEALPVGVALVDAKGANIRANREFDRIWGEPRPPAREDGDFTAYRAWWADNGEALRPEDWASARAVHRGETVIGQMLEIERFDGSRTYVLNSAAPVLDGEGRVTGSAGAIQDISELKRAETELIAAHARTLDILESIGDGFFSLDREWRVTHINEKGARLIGKRREELVGRSLWDSFPEAVGSVFYTAYQRAMEERIAVSVEDFYPPLNAWYEAHAYPSQEGLSVFYQDVTDHKLADGALRRSRERLDWVLDITGVGLWMNELPLGTLNWDHRTRELFFVPEGVEPTVEMFWELLHPEDREPTRLAVERAIRERTLYGIDHRAVNPATGESRWIRSAGMATYREDGTPARFDGINYDITERKRALEELADANAALAEADRRKDEFLAMLAHELRNPLAPVRNAVQILNMVGSSDPMAQKNRDIIERQVGHMGRLVDDLLDVSRITRGKITLRVERLDLRTVVQQAVEVAAHTMQSRNLELRYTPPEEGVWIDGDTTRLEQVVGNLLNNAIKYTDAGGIMMELGCEGEEAMGGGAGRRGRNEHEHEGITDRAARATGWAVVRVRDTGIGIEPEVLPRIFELFAQADQSLDRTRGGLGIGLTMVQRLVELHGGTVEARSDGPDRGSEFVVRLPMAAGAPTAGQPEPLEMDTGGLNGEATMKVLVVDDNRDAAESLKELLELWGYQAHMAYDGPEAVEMAQAFAPDVVLLDIGLPGMSGYAVARRLREEPALETTRIIALTGYGQDEDRRMSNESGFDAHMVKPVDLKALRAMLRKMTLGEIGR